ncbi:MAG: CvpA family protein [Fibrobacter sp.]|jgi:membrane protein required for colicin V production|nr:CvpA family protein [Fibrobacter sp.]
MNYIDLFFLFILMLFVGFGFWAGFVKSLFKLAAWIGGVAGAYFGDVLFGNFLQLNVAADPLIIKILCYVLGFIIPFIILNLIGYFLTRFLKATPLSGANRLFGAAFGALKALIFCGFLAAIICLLPLRESLKTERDTSVGISLYRGLWENITDSETFSRVLPPPPLPKQ